MEAAGVKSFRFLVETLEGLEDFAGPVTAAFELFGKARGMTPPRDFFASGRRSWLLFFDLGFDLGIEMGK